MPIECTCPADEMPFGRCCKAPTSADVIAGLEMALAQAAAMIERQQHVMQRAMDAWDTTTHQKNGDGRLWQCMEELRGECGKQPNGGSERREPSARLTCYVSLDLRIFAWHLKKYR